MIIAKDNVTSVKPFHDIERSISKALKDFNNRDLCKTGPVVIVFRIPRNYVCKVKNVIYLICFFLYHESF
jgi:hypothetical protein